jgi:hypothetical protein
MAEAKPNNALKPLKTIITFIRSSGAFRGWLPPVFWSMSHRPHRLQ